MLSITKYLIVFFLHMAVLIACNDSGADTEGNDANPNPPPPAILYSVVNVYPHDTASFTQGLSFYDGQLLESTGLNNTSWLGPVDLKTGKIDRKVTLTPEHFGEGNTVLDGKIYHITWQSKKGFVYDAKTFKKLKEFSYVTEGWGITNDGKNLIMSAGTSNLFFLDPDTLNVVKTLTVTDNYGAVPNLNELEYIDGYIYANQWQTPYILKIDPANGQVVGKLDMKNLEGQIKSKNPNFDFSNLVLNGIAYDSSSKKIFVTGKKWPHLYEIKIQ